MSRDTSHFPTFEKAAHAFVGRDEPLRAMLGRERTWLRLGLYFLLILTIIQIGSTALINVRGPANPTLAILNGYGGPQAEMPILSTFAVLTTKLMGQSAHVSLVVVALCLTGLAASSRPGPAISLPAVPPTPPPPSRPRPEPPPPGPPAPHPLDPDPDDPPVEGLWGRK